MHVSYEIINYLPNNEINYVYISNRLTTILQPLFVSIKHHFKIAIIHEYEFL